MTENKAKVLLCQMYLPCFEDIEKEAITMAITVLEEIQQYRAIGSVEELKALKEKSVAKKVVVQHVPKTSWTREVSHYLCPCCNHIFSFGGTTYCSRCGQKIDWKGGGNNAESN